VDSDRSSSQSYCVSFLEALRIHDEEEESEEELPDIGRAEQSTLLT